MNSPFLLVNFPNPLASDCWSIQRLARFQGPGSTDEECCTRADLPVPWPCGKGNSFGGELGLFIWDIWVWYLKMLEKNNIKFTALEHLVSLSIFFGWEYTKFLDTPTHDKESKCLLKFWVYRSLVLLAPDLCSYFISSQETRDAEKWRLAISKWLPDGQTEESSGDAPYKNNSWNFCTGWFTLAMYHIPRMADLQDIPLYIGTKVVSTLNFPKNNPKTSRKPFPSRGHAREAGWPWEMAWKKGGWMGKTRRCEKLWGMITVWSLLTHG